MPPRSAKVLSWLFNCVSPTACLQSGSAPRNAGQRRHLEALHARVLVSDDRAVEEICRLLLTAGQRIVRARRPTADPFTIEDAVLDAVDKYLHRPERFDRERSALLSWISLIAIHHVDDQREHEDARRAAEAVVAPVARQALLRQWSPAVGIKHLVLKATASRRERKFLVAWFRHRPFEDLVRILGISHLPPAIQIQQVSRHKERLRLRMKRIAAKIRQEGAAGRQGSHAASAGATGHALRAPNRRLSGS